MLSRSGIFGLVDGQFGSTGKGLFAAYLSHYADKIDYVVTNGGPNSGHTFYNSGGEKIVLKQLPTMAVAAKLRGIQTNAFISAGAIVDPDILNAEVDKYGVRTLLMDTACIVKPSDKEAEHSGSIAAVAGTRQGVGHALSRKVQRHEDAVIRNNYVDWHPMIRVVSAPPNWLDCSAFVEVSQGFSLGIHSAFYPKVTSRECTIAQGLADARIPPQSLRQVFMVIRTFPIRVGNVDEYSSGNWYPDQEELSWEKIGVAEELTTVTKRVRRVASFSMIQYRESLIANYPGVILVNFMNYLNDPKTRRMFSRRVMDEARRTLGYLPKFLWGYGPNTQDIVDRVT